MDEVDLSDTKIFDEVESVVKIHNVDISDAFQIVTVKRGKHSKFSGESKSLLITADTDLAIAAKAEGINTWDCLNDPVPKI